MKKQIVNVSVLQSAKVAAALYLVVSIPMCLLMLIPAMMSPNPGAGFSVVMLIMMPVMYTVFGFIFTLISAWIYNELRNEWAASNSPRWRSPQIDLNHRGLLRTGARGQVGYSDISSSCYVRLPDLIPVFHRKPPFDTP